MNAIAIAVPLYVVLTMIMGYTWNMVLFNDLYLSIGGEGKRAEPVMILGVSSMLLEAFALSILFLQYFKGQNFLLEGLCLGLLVGAFSICYAAFVVPAKFAIDPVWKYICLEVVFGILHFCIAGILFGYIFSKWGNI